MNGTDRAQVLLVAKKELLEIVRDKRSLFVLLLLPVILYPLMFIGSILALTAQVRKMAAAEHVVWVEGLDTLPPALVDQLGEVKTAKGQTFKLKLVEKPAGSDVDVALSERKVSAVIKDVPREVPLAPDEPLKVGVLYNGGVDASNFVRQGIQRAVTAWREAIVTQRLKERGLQPGFLKPVVSEAVDRGAPGAILGRMLSALLVMLALTGAFYPALDLGAGEKERGTLETLLLAPVPRVNIALGKFVAVFAISLAAALLHLLSLGLTFSSFAAFAPQKMPGLEVPLVLFPAMLMVLLPLVALFSALSLALATFASSYKEGQAYLTPLVLVGTAPALAAALPGMELTSTLCLVPVVNAALLMKGLLARTVGLGPVLLVVSSSFAFAWIALRWVASLYDREEVLWRPAAAQAPDLFGLRGESTGEIPPTLPQAIALGTLALLLLWFVGMPLQGWNMAAGLALTLIVLIATPAVVYARMLKADLVETFKLRAASPLAFAGVILLALGCAALVLDVVHLQGNTFGEISPREQKALEERAVDLLSLGPAMLIVLMAVLPGICEEVLFRGFVLTGLRRGAGTPAAILVSSLLFSFLHLDPARLMPTFIVGAVLGLVVVRVGSLFPAILLHMLYNTTVLGMQAYGEKAHQLGLLTAGLDRPTWLARGLALAAVAAGAALVWVAGRKPAPVEAASESG